MFFFFFSIPPKRMFKKKETTLINYWKGKRNFTVKTFLTKPQKGLLLYTLFNGSKSSPNWEGNFPANFLSLTKTNSLSLFLSPCSKPYHHRRRRRHLHRTVFSVHPWRRLRRSTFSSRRGAPNTKRNRLQNLLRLRLSLL